MWTVVATVAHVLAQSSAILFVAGGPLSHFRTFVDGDQLGYMAMSANVLDGQSPRVEPYTETGTNTYPPLYYTLIGWVARIVHVNPVVAWNLTGLLIQALMAAVLATTLIRLSHRGWSALLAPAVFMMGTFSWLQGHHWYHRYASHATMWGPYGSLTVLNAESAGLAVGVIALCLMARAWLVPSTPRRSLLLTMGAALLVGAIANFQTYSFLTFVYVIGAAVSLTMILSGRRWVTAGISLVVLVGMYVVGPSVAVRIGQLPTLVLGLAPFVPGLVWVVIRRPVASLLTGLACIVAAVPQVVMTLHDLRSGDPFLTYRVASNKDLGVTHWWTIVAMLVALVPLIGVLVLAWWRRAIVPGASALAAIIAWVFAATNDAWGANAEPYRLWIDGLVIGGVVACLCLARFAGPTDIRTQGDSPSDTTPRAAASDTASVDDQPDVAASASPTTSGPVSTGRPPRMARDVRLVLVVSALVFVLALPDYSRWVRDRWIKTTWNPANARSQAVATLSRQADDHSGGLLLVDRCINPQYAKVTSGAPVAYYRLGMAWPKNRDAIDTVFSQSHGGRLDLGAAQRADVRYVLVDSVCGQAWLGQVRPSLHQVGKVEYTPDAKQVDGAAPRKFVAKSGAAATPAIILYRLGE